MKRELTSGSVMKNLLFFSLPYLLSFFLQTLYGMADLLIIGQFGSVADTTAVSVGSQVMHMLTVMIVGLAMGATVNIGQAVGGKDSRKAALFTGNTVTLFTDSAAVIRLGGGYLRGYAWDCLFAGIHFAFSGYFCACGKSGISFMHNIIAILLVRVPGSYLMSSMFPETLYPMGLTTAAGSLLSALICAAAFVIIQRKNVT